MKKLVLLACLLATSLQAQIKISTLPRATPTTGLADSTLFLVNDSTKLRTVGVKFSDIQKRLSYKAFDSLVISNSIRTTAGGIHAIDTTLTDPRIQLLFGGSFTPGGTGSGRAISIRTTFNPAIGGDTYGIEVIPKIVEQSSGTHGLLAGINVSPTITNGAAITTDVAGINVNTIAAGAGTTNASGLLIAGPSGATNNFALRVTAGTTRLDDSTLTAAIRPLADNTYALGSTTFRFTTVDAVTRFRVGSSGFLDFNNRTQVSSTADGTLVLTNNAGSSFTSLLLGGTTSSFAGFFPSGTNIGVKKADGSGYADMSVQNLSMQGGAVIEAIQNVTYSASMTINAATGNSFVITATNGTAFTINAPSNPNTGQFMTVTIRNTSGGALGVATWNAVFKMAAWTQPANGFSRSITFRYDGTNWVEMYRAAADIPN